MQSELSQIGQTLLKSINKSSQLFSPLQPVNGLGGDALDFFIRYFENDVWIIYRRKFPDEVPFYNLATDIIDECLQGNL